MPNTEASIAIIGGTGLYQMDGLSGVETIDVDTPFGKPSDDIVLGSLDETRVAFLPRHGRRHELNPTRIPARANIYALKRLGVQRIISVSAVGSLKDELAPLDLVLPDQLIDRTRSRESTFFDEDIVVHVSLAEPFCPVAGQVLQHHALELGVKVHAGGALVVMEGPAFSTRAESLMYRSWGADIIGMTALPEAKLAREAEICYTTLAWVTDYDCWRQGEEAVTAEMIIGNLTKNVASSKELLRRVIPVLGRGLAEDRECECGMALKNAIVTPLTHVQPEYLEKLKPIVGKYLR